MLLMPISMHNFYCMKVTIVGAGNVGATAADVIGMKRNFADGCITRY